MVSGLTSLRAAPFGLRVCDAAKNFPGWDEVTTLFEHKEYVNVLRTTQFIYRIHFIDIVALRTIAGFTKIARNPSIFFRANRQFIVSHKAIKDISVWFDSKLAVNLTVDTSEKVIVSRGRVAEFKEWYSGGGGKK